MRAAPRSNAITSTQLARTETVTAVVFEKRSRWAPELERQFTNESVRIVACRSLRDVAERSADVARGVIVLDLAADTAECLRFLGGRLGDAAVLPIFVVGSGRTAALEWTVRELGATAFFPTTIPGHEMADLCRRQWGRVNGPGEHDRHAAQRD